ncbi:hypothetical protein [uncultured Polaribacter sp.]|uniref:hypothetical protein n=1 Tax=uncultured Polaribacter sp. TaxID=174711 RepID=UPI00259B1AC2|nr:hypothetical protein [uncultured Polaribacter sp.]
MRIFILPILFILLNSSAFGQQFLWSTIEKDSIAEKHIPLEYVNNEILKFYDHYEKHYDLSGYSKKRFIEEIDYGFDDWKWINDINDLTVFAVKSNTGSGSVVLVMFISEKNINLIIFSNQVLGRNFNYQSNYEFERKKFETWLKTLMN